MSSRIPPGSENVRPIGSPAFLHGPGIPGRRFALNGPIFERIDPLTGIDDVHDELVAERIPLLNMRAEKNPE